MEFAPSMRMLPLPKQSSSVGVAFIASTTAPPEALAFSTSAVSAHRR